MGVNWKSVFVPQMPTVEIVVRGTVVYLALFLLLRLVLKRQSGGLGMTDLLVLVLIADAAQNAMAGSYRTVTDGLALVVVIVFWAYVVDWLSYHVRLFERLVQPPRLQLVKDGQLLRRNMRRELVTEDELLSQLRLHGERDLAEVDAAFIESDGRISFLTRRGDAQEVERRQLG
jgi:uncharacterized membrane protein YcaP (DUF421 family)